MRYSHVVSLLPGALQMRSWETDLDDHKSLFPDTWAASCSGVSSIRSQTARKASSSASNKGRVSAIGNQLAASVHTWYRENLLGVVTNIQGAVVENRDITNRGAESLMCLDSVLQTYTQKIKVKNGRSSFEHHRPRTADAIKSIEAILRDLTHRSPVRQTTLGMLFHLHGDRTDIFHARTQSEDGSRSASNSLSEAAT